MILQWMLYAAVVSGLVAAAGWLAERAVRGTGRSTRWIWVGAMAASLSGPAIAWAWPGGPSASALVGVPGTYVLETLTFGVAAAPSPGPSLEAVVRWSWVGASLLLLGIVGALALRLDLRRRRWPRRVLDGVEVLVSRAVGPAAFGLVRGRIVVPEWALKMEPRQRRLLVLHEAEHLRARDPQLAWLALLACVLTPWNLPLWWQLRRLRGAIEMDCDARVLRRAAQPRSYGALLLTVGQRRAHLALALVESRGMLRRRLEMLTQQEKSARALVRSLPLLVASGVVLAVACDTPAPTDADGTTPAEAVHSATEAAGGAGSSPATAGTEGQVDLGNGIRVIGGSCPEVFVDDRASSMEEVRAMAPEEIARIEVLKGAAAGSTDGCGEIHVTTKAAAGEGPPVQAAVPQASEAPADVAAAPTFTPMTVRPNVTNADRVTELLASYYPPLLRDAGIGGSPSVWFFIGPSGEVEEVRLNESSGYEALDQAALAVARQMEFTPARNGDTPVAVWISLDMRFEVD